MLLKVWSFQCTRCSRLLFYRTSLTSHHSSGGQWFYAHCSSKTNRAHSQVDRHSSNFKFLPKHYFDIRTTNFFVGHVVSSDDRSIQIFATYSRNTTSVSPLRTHRKLGQLQEYDVTRTWDLRARNSARTWSVLGQLLTWNMPGFNILTITIH